MKFQLPALPWKKNDFEPFLSPETIETHYYGHHKGYIDKTNDLISRLGLENVTLEKIVLNYDGSLYENAAQAWNHSFYWMGLSAKAPRLTANGDFVNAVIAQFGSLDGMRDKFIDCGSNLFGSGWTWLVGNESGELDFVNTHNGDNPIRFEDSHPLWTADIWEHAYYLDYRNHRREYLEGIWDHINWSFVEECFRLKRIPNMSRLMVVENEPPLSTLLT